MAKTTTTIGYRSRKAAQASSYFATQQGGKIDKLKLIKLLYLADRESLKHRGRPMFYDEHYSLKHGPIGSNSLNGINGELDKPVWEQYLKRQTNVRIAATGADNYDEISKSDMALMESVWKKFGWMTASQLRNWTHQNCREYVLVENGRLPISYSDIYKALGFPNPHEIDERIKAYRSAEAAISKQ